MSPEQFLETVVRPAVTAAFDDQLCLWKAMAAVAVTDTLAAHIFVATNEPGAARDDSAFRHVLGKENADFELLFHVAKAHKHVRLTKGDPRVTDAEATKVSTLGYGEGAFGEGPYGGGPQIIVVDRHGGKRNLHGLVRGALSFLETKLPHQA